MFTLKIEDIKATRERIINQTPRSCWARGVQAFAVDLLDRLIEDGSSPVSNLHSALLNGAKDWHQFSWGGCMLAYDQDIAERFCTPSELKRLKYKEGGFKKPNAREEWLDLQARALYQAELLIMENVFVSPA